MVDTRTPQEYVRQVSMCGPYSIDQALDIVDHLNTMPTGFDTQIRWVNSKTGNPVAIGRCGGTGKRLGKKDKSEKNINPFNQVTQKQTFRNLSKIHSRKW
jgi:hypothetical protein